MDEGDVRRAYDTYGAAVLGRCRRLLRDEHAARDVLQEVFIRCFEKRSGLRADRALLGWLYKVATNLCLNALRDGRVRRAYAEAPAPSDDPERVHAGPDDRASTAEVMAVLEGLDPRTQAIAVLTFVDGMTQPEVAEVLGISDRSVRNGLNRFLAHGRLRLGTQPKEGFG